MSQSVHTILEAIAPVVATSASVDTFIHLALSGVNPSHFGEQYTYAVALRTAHIGSLALRSSIGDAGAVSSKKEGDLSISFNTNSGGDAYWSQTSYGLGYLDLVKSTNVALGATGGLDSGCGGYIPPIIGCSGGW